MKFNKAITIVMLTLSFCIFDQIKNKLVEKGEKANGNQHILASGFDKIRNTMTAKISPASGCEDSDSVKGSDAVFIDSGENICEMMTVVLPDRLIDHQ